MSRTRAALAAVVLLALALGGCTDDDPDPRSSPPPSSSEPASPSTSATADLVGPTMPDVADERSDVGAEAFVRHFVEVLNHAQATGDTTTLKSLSSMKCRGCAGYVQGIRAAYDDGGHIEGGEIALGELRVLPNDFGSDWAAYASGTAGPQEIIDADGGRRSFDGGKFALYAYVKWANDGWVMQWIRTPS